MLGFEPIKIVRYLGYQRYQGTRCVLIQVALKRFKARTRPRQESGSNRTQVFPFAKVHTERVQCGCVGVWLCGCVGVCVCAGAGAHHVVRQGGAQELVVVGRVGRGAGAVQRAARVRRAAAAVPRHHCGDTLMYCHRAAYTYIALQSN